ncbi:MAG: hypothetical protein F6K30_20530 [Cyanothece sp. SIO2G6]|nr:hypothetical protein [Cyanothece sp. SIO2G6]
MMESDALSIFMLHCPVDNSCLGETLRRLLGNENLLHFPSMAIAPRHLDRKFRQPTEMTPTADRSR